ncbi:hypothetical protein ACFPYI_06100 [Halomarina salina]|uniref:DUF4129 domain-containing protein n=1 Tax=Halomarina salina TaxID=1872699 RepID=A0ABD5RKR5_9EURY|nr:hypothetical protein [Halomarina salina]
MRKAVAVGVVTVVVGLVAAVGLVTVPLPSALVTVVGLVAVLVALQAARQGLGPSEAPVLPTPERRQAATVPGDEFDESLASASRHGRIGGATDRDAVRDRLREVAVEVLTRYDGDTPEQARRRLAEGTWTDDAHAAAFFGSDADSSVTVADRVRFFVTSDSAFRRQAAHVVAVLDRRVAGGR